jgi:hypothetical protein
LADKWTGIVSVDYRLLHHFRVSQRRQMASRGELPVRFNRTESSELDAFESYDDGALELVDHSATPHLQVPGVQVLTHLLNEDR